MRKHSANLAKLTAKFDWLEVTIKHQSPKSIIENVLNLRPSEFNALKNGRFGYNHQIKWENGNFFLLYNRTEGHYVDDEMGVHLILTGSGCDSFAANVPLRDLIMLVIGGTDYQFTRIDLAIDDKQEQLLWMNRIQRYVGHNFFTSRWANRLEVTKFQNSDNHGIGKTIYFGSKRSTLYCRFYDKALEQRQKYKNDRKRLAKLPEDWTRMEIVFKKSRANLLAEHLVRDDRIGKAVREVMNNYLRFLRPGTDTHRHRWATAAWWHEFIGEVGKLKLTEHPADRTIEQMSSWLDRQISPTLNIVMKAHEGDLTWFIKMIRRADSRLKRRQLDALSQYLSDSTERKTND